MSFSKQRVNSFGSAGGRYNWRIGEVVTFHPPLLCYHFVVDGGVTTLDRSRSSCAKWCSPMMMRQVATNVLTMMANTVDCNVVIVSPYRRLLL